MANRYVELNPDPQSRSDRPEWCFVRYDHTYHPLRAFQFELQWMVTTIEIFHQVVSPCELSVCSCTLYIINRNFGHLGISHTVNSAVLLERLSSSIIIKDVLSV